VSSPYDGAQSYRPFQRPAEWQPQADKSFSSGRGLGLAASILICLVAFAEVLVAVSDWYTYRVVKQYIDAPVDPGSLDRADRVAGVVIVGYMLVLLAAGVVFIVWLWRMRSNAELFCEGQHRHGRGWVIGGWFCPVVNLWFPKQIVDDVIAASDPRTPPRVPDLSGAGRSGTVLVWWITWLAGIGLGNLGGADFASDVPTVDDLLTTAGMSTAGAVVTAVCAVLSVRLIDLVNHLQLSRPWVPWWATAPSQ